MGIYRVDRVCKSNVIIRKGGRLKLNRKEPIKKWQNVSKNKLLCVRTNDLGWGIVIYDSSDKMWYRVKTILIYQRKRMLEYFAIHIWAIVWL